MIIRQHDNVPTFKSTDSVKIGFVEPDVPLSYVQLTFKNHLDAMAVPLPHDNSAKWAAYAGQHTGDTQDWLGAPSFSEAEKRLRLGWPEGATEAMRSLSMIELPDTKRRNARRWSSDGEMLDPHRALLQMHPEPFRICRRTASPIVTINVNIGDSCSISAENIRWRGAIVIKISDTLTAAGFSVGINAVSFGKGTFHQPAPTYQAIITPLKDPGEPLRVALLAGQLFTTATWRLAHFRAMHATQWKPTDGLGYCVDMIPKPLLGDFYIPRTVLSRASAQSYIDHLVEYGSETVQSMFAASAA